MAVARWCCIILPLLQPLMPAKTQADMDVRLAEIRKLLVQMTKLRLVEGAEQQREAEALAAKIQEQAANIRARIRQLLN